VYGDTTVRWT